MAEVRTVSVTGAEKGVKPQRYDLIPPGPLMELARLYGVGARKYADHNFRRGYEWNKSYAGLQRHASLFWAGESYDLEMHVNHMASVAWHACALTEFFYSFPNFDDRVRGNREGAQDIVMQPFASPQTGQKHVDDYGDRRAADVAEPRFDLIPQYPLAQLAQFYGEEIAKPATIENRRWSDYYARLQEHAQLFWAGENFAADGFLHSVHMLHYALSLIEAYNMHPDLDDRLIRGAVPIGFTSDPTPPNPSETNHTP